MNERLHWCKEKDALGMLLLPRGDSDATEEALVQQVVHENIPVCPQLPPSSGTPALSRPGGAPRAPGSPALTQSSMCLDISGTSTRSFSAVTIRAGIKIWGEMTGGGDSQKRGKCPLLAPSTI